MNNILVLQIEDRDDSLLNKLMNQNKKVCLENDIKYNYLKKSSHNIPPYWAKVFEIYKIMKKNLDITHIIWLDSDAFFYNFDKQKLNNLINEHSEYSMIISKDMPPWENKEFNAGSFIIKNDTIGQNIISKWMKLYNPDKWIFFANKWLADSDWAAEDYEQGAFIKYILTDENYIPHIKQLPFYILNNNNCCDSNPSILIVHLAGYHKHSKINVNNCLESFNENKSISLIIITIIILCLLRFC